MRKHLALTIVPLALASSIAAAQEKPPNERETRLTSLEEILVTAQKRESSLQDTPISIAAFSGEQLERFGIDDFGDLAGLAPNVDITPFPNSRSSLVVFMRGVGNNDSQTTQDPAVGVYIDGVYVGRSVGLTGDIANIARVEVLRGPQGTLYGRNTTGGAVNIITDQPSGEFGEYSYPVRLSQLIGDIGDRIKYVAGLYYFEEDASEHEVDITFSAGGATDPILEDRSISSHNEAKALYGQISYVVPALEDCLELTLGGRYTQDDRQARKRSKLFTNSPNNTQEDSASYSNFNPSFTADFSWTDKVNTYAKVVTGYKSGGFNVRSTEAGFSPAFDEEKMISYEIGSKLSLFSNRLSINAAGFISEYTDLQIQQITDYSAIFLTDVFNAGEVEINGFELDLVAVTLPGLTLSASYGYTDADFVKFIDNSPDSPTFGQNVASDATAPYAPEETYTVGLDYLFPEMAVGDLRFNLDYAWRDERFGTARNDDMEGFKLDDYGLLNARLSLSKIPLGFAEASIAVWGKNLDNEDYLVHSISLGVVRSGYWNEPQTYGLDISVDF